MSLFHKGPRPTDRQTDIQKDQQEKKFCVKSFYFGKIGYLVKISEKEMVWEKSIFKQVFL